MDKSDFKCLKTADGAIYYGHVVQILPPDVETDKLAGFAPREESKKRIIATRGSEASMGGAAAMRETHSSAGALRTATASKPETVDPL